MHTIYQYIVTVTGLTIKIQNYDEFLHGKLGQTTLKIEKSIKSVLISENQTLFLISFSALKTRMFYIFHLNPPKY